MNASNEKAEAALNAMATDINTTDDIIVALEVLGGAALMAGNRRLYEHIYKAKVEYEKGVHLGWSDHL